MQRAQGLRLQAIRKAAGYTSARSASMEHGWSESAYRAHENGTRAIKDAVAMKYIATFKAEGAKGYTVQWLKFGEDIRLDEKLSELPPDLAMRAVLAAMNVIDKARK